MTSSIGPQLLRDVRLAWRALVRAPAFALSVTGVLAIAFALLGTTLAVVNIYLVRSLPYPAGGRLYHVMYAPVGTPEPRGLGAMDWRGLADIVEFADSSASTRFLVPSGTTMQEVLGVLAAPGISGAFGIRVALGRRFAPGDFDPAAERVALISASFWRSRFGGDSAVIGRTFLAGSVAGTTPPSVFHVIGVLDGEYRDVRAYARGAVDIVTPIRRTYRTYVVRLRAGVPPAMAQRRLTSAVRSVAAALPRGWDGVRLESLDERYARPVRPVLTAVTIAAVLVLLLACANVAVLMLLRAVRRQTEIAVRMAFGAGTVRILRLLAVESALVCGAAIAIALPVSAAAIELLASRIQSVLGQPVPGGAANLRIDSVVAAVIVSCGIAVAMALSAVPLIVPWREQLTRALRRGGRGATEGAATRRVRSGLVASQVALSVALTVGCGLTIRSALHLLHTDLGVGTGHLVRTRIVPPRRAFPDSAALSHFNERLETVLRARMGDRVALSNFPALLEPTPVAIEGSNGAGGAQLAGLMAVSPSFFAVLGMRLLRGRGFAETDDATSKPVAVISETLARRLSLTAGAPSTRIRVVETPGEATAAPWRTVVGVVSDVRQSYTDDNLSDAYVPFLQEATPFSSVYARTSASDAWLDSVRATVGDVYPQVLVSAAIRLDVEAQRQLAGPEFLATVLVVFALVAALLAVLGNYAVVAYAVQQRELEIAIRTALGASSEAIVGLLVRQGAVIVGGGIACGAIGAVAVGRVLRSQLHGVSPFDPLTLVIGSAAIGVLALVFVWWPARRAAAISPAIALNEG